MMSRAVQGGPRWWKTEEVAATYWSGQEALAQTQCNAEGPFIDVHRVRLTRSYGVARRLGAHAGSGSAWRCGAGHARAQGRSEVAAGLGAT
jgi:hypothetical protein